MSDAISVPVISTLDPVEQLGVLQQKSVQQQRRITELEINERILELKVQKYERMLWARKSERLAPADDKQKLLFADPAGPTPAPMAATKSEPKERGPRAPKGPKPLDPALPREMISVPAPSLKELICPETKQPMKPGFIEQLEVLARRAPEYYVKRYERTVFVSPAKTAPVYAPWPAEIKRRLKGTG